MKKISFVIPCYKSEDTIENVVEEIQEEAPKKSFFLYITMVPKILTYFRRERGIAKKYLELVLIDNEEQLYSFLENYSS